jgi:hypothetical protein
LVENKNEKQQETSIQNKDSVISKIGTTEMEWPFLAEKACFQKNY